MTIKGVVFIFGGVTSQKKHFADAISVYEKLDFHIEFFEAPGMKAMIVKELNKTVEKAVKLYEKNKTEWKNVPFIIHTISGGIFTSIEFNNIKKSDAFIGESFPVDGENFDNTQIAFEKLLKMPLNRALAEYVVSCFGIPTKKYNQKWFDELKPKFLNLPNTVIMNGEKDEYLDKEYVKKFIGHLEENNISTKYVSFDDDSHYKLADSNLKLYQDTIEETINNTIEKFNEKKSNE